MTEHHNPEEPKPFVDAEDAKDVPPTPESPKSPGDAEQLAESIKRAATETAYATVGLVDLVSSKARNFYEDQKRQYASAHPDEDEKTTSGFLTQLGSQLDKLVDDIASSFKDLAERGRKAGQSVEPEAELTGDVASPESPISPESPVSPESPASPSEAIDPDQAQA